MRELLSDSARACAGWLDFEISGMLIGLFVGAALGFFLGIWKNGPNV
jgi:hypothetical protein